MRAAAASSAAGAGTRARAPRERPPRLAAHAERARLALLPARPIFNLASSLVPPRGISHSDTKVIYGISKELMFDTIADVGKYAEFLPWCQQSIVHRASGAAAHPRPDAPFRATLKVGFGPVTDSYTSRVTLSRPTTIAVVAEGSETFEFLRTTWTFADVPGKAKSPRCRVSVDIEFKFRSVVSQQLASTFLSEVGRRMLAAFEARVRTLRHEKPRF